MDSSAGVGGPIKRGPYRRYLRDTSLPIPRTTLWRSNSKAVRNGVNEGCV